MDQLKFGFKRKNKWNKYQSKVTILQLKSKLDYLIDSSFQGINRTIVASFPNNTVRTGVTKYFIQSLEMEDYNFMIDGQIFFDQPVKINIITYSTIGRILTSQGDHYATGCLLFCRYFNGHYKTITLYADLKTIQQISFTENLD